MCLTVKSSQSYIGINDTSIGTNAWYVEKTPSFIVRERKPGGGGGGGGGEGGREGGREGGEGGREGGR